MAGLTDEEQHELFTTAAASRARNIANAKRRRICQRLVKRGLLTATATKTGESVIRAIPADYQQWNYSTPDDVQCVKAKYPA